MMKKLKTTATALFLITLISACDTSEPLKPLSQNDVILAFGDSLTYGTGAPNIESYPALLQNILGITVVNAGIPGEISSEGRARLPKLLDEIKPSLVILCHGGNDLLRKGNLQQLKRNLHNMIKQTHARGVPLILIAVPAPNMLLTPPALYQELAEEFRLNIDTEIMTQILSDRTLKSDAIHPNAVGYRILAEAIAEKLEIAGAVELKFSATP